MKQVPLLSSHLQMRNWATTSSRFPWWHLSLASHKCSWQVLQDFPSLSCFFQNLGLFISVQREEKQSTGPLFDTSVSSGICIFLSPESLTEMSTEGKNYGQTWKFTCWVYTKILMSILQWPLRTLLASGLTGWTAWEVDLLKHERKLYPLGEQGGAGESG